MEKILEELNQLRERYRIVNERVNVLEDELRKSESRYNSILQSFPDAQRLFYKSKIFFVLQ